MENKNDIVYPDSDQIDPEQARFLFEHHCALLVIENLPPGSEVGIDLSYFRTGDKFKGIKLIPPGLHFVYASAVDKKKPTICGPRSGFYHNFLPKELLVKEWSESEEEFRDDSLIDHEQIIRYKANLHDLDRYLGAYRYSTLRRYLALTSKLTTDIVDSLTPDCKRFRSVAYLIDNTQNCSIDSHNEVRRKRGIYKKDDSVLPNFSPEKSTLINFTDLCSNDHCELLNEELTNYNLDTTTKLTKCFPNEQSRRQLLAEFQFAFVTFIMCHHFTCFEHWQAIIKLICQADKALELYPELFEGFIKILGVQLEEVPEDLFDDIVDSNNLVRCMLDTLFENIRESPDLPRNIHNLMQTLRTRLEQRFGWIFELQRDDEQPVIVNTYD